MVTYMSEKMGSGWDKVTDLSESEIKRADELMGDFKETKVETAEEIERDFVIKQTTAEAVSPTPEEIIVADEILEGSPLADATIAEGYVAPTKPGDTYGKNFAQPLSRPVKVTAPEKSFWGRLFGG